MAKKRKLDNIDLDMIECEKAGFGCHYGRWKATQPIKQPEPVELPEEWKVCAHCGKSFKPNVPYQKYCEALCGYEAGMDRYKQKRLEATRAYRARKKAEMGG